MILKKFVYPEIDMKKTGEKIRCKVKNSAYSVKEIQEYLHLSCPQPIYRWFKGQTLPTVDHFYALGRLLGISMEEMIVPVHQEQFWLEICWMDQDRRTAKRKKYLQVYEMRMARLLD